MLRIAEAKLGAGDFEGVYKTLYPADSHHSWDKMSDRSDEALSLEYERG